MQLFQLTYKAFGEKAILIEWPALIYEAILADRMRFEKAIRYSDVLQSENTLTDIVPAYHSLTLVYKHTITNLADLVTHLRELYRNLAIDDGFDSNLYKVPVCYDLEIAPDLESFAQSKSMILDEIIRIHTESIYCVYFIGFLPGFLYLGGLDQRLHMPRKANPDMHLPKGAVAIGGEQTGIYPQESPGGWHVIGNSPVGFFNPNTEPVCFAQAGDCIQFTAVGFAEYQNIKEQVEAGEFVLKREKPNA